MSIFSAQEIAELKELATMAFPDVDNNVRDYFQLQIMPDAAFLVFTIQRETTTKVAGNIQNTYNDVGTLSGVLGLPTPEEVNAWQQQQHPITHHIAQVGVALAVPGDRLVLGSRHFYIQSVDDPQGFGTWTRYNVQERKDA